MPPIECLQLIRVPITNLGIGAITKKPFGNIKVTQNLELTDIRKYRNYFRSILQFHPPVYSVGVITHFT